MVQANLKKTWMLNDPDEIRVRLGGFILIQDYRKDSRQFQHEFAQLQSACGR